MLRTNRRRLWLLLAGILPGLATAEDTVDFSDQIAPTCELIGLVATPPEGWFSVSVQEMPTGMAGCQMMRVNEAEELVGVMRLRSSETGEIPPGDESRDELLASELRVLEAMGLQVGEPIWSRNDVPISGLAFAGAQALGLAAVIEESGLPQEIHVLAFRGPFTQYALLLITPHRDAESEIYERNVADFGRLFQTLNVPAPTP